MAHIVEERITIVVSQLTADDAEVSSALSDELESNILEVAKAMVPEGSVVELKKE